MNYIAVGRDDVKAWIAGAALALGASGAIAQPARDADAWARTMLQKLTPDERLGLLRGKLPPRMAEAERPAGLVMGAGYVAGVPRLGIPALMESDASLGVANMGGFMRRNDVATALPSATAMAASWDVGLVEAGGAAIGAEARAKGFNVLLAGGANLVREPRNGRNFEYYSEDVLLSGVLAGHAIRGIQSNHIVSTIKHYALNAQETGRTILSANIGEAALRESDLLAFQIGIEIGEPGSVMCAYNRINSVYACENGFLLNDVLRRDWGYPGWVMSDWGAVHSPSIRAGLDQESGTQPKDTPWFGTLLRDELAAGRVTQADIDRSALRILRTMRALGLDTHAATPGSAIDYEAHGRVAQRIAEEGIVLLRNEGGLLPVAATARRILLIGGHADVGVPSGGGSSQVNPVGGASLSLAIPGDAIYHRRLYMPSSPLKALRALLPAAEIAFDDGTDRGRAAAAARGADLVIVFGEQFTAEGSDVATLSLPDDQDGLIAAVADANPKTVVVLETGGPVTMPWLDKVGAVLAAWYPGQRGGEAIARVLSGAVNPSGRLPVTFPRTVDQSPNPRLPGSLLVKGQDGKDLYDLPKDQKPFDVSYPEGADVGYRWYDRTGATPLFAFGHGLSYTSFTYRDLTLRGGSALGATLRITNVGARAGAEVAQLYVRVNGARRLVGWSRVELAPGESRTVTIAAEPRLLAAFDVQRRNWTITAGSYAVEVGKAVDQPQLTGQVRLAARRIKP
jgi:beta-glucosidase